MGKPKYFTLSNSKTHKENESPPQCVIIWVSSTLQKCVLNLYLLPSNEGVAETYVFH